MQELFEVIPIVAIGWMIWGSWMVLRPNSGFFDKRYYSDSDVDIRTYLAFIGFWIALVLIIYIPTNWLLGLILPEHWGSYSSEDGEWSSYGERIAGLTAALGSLVLIARMFSTGRTILQIEFWTNRFRPKEVTACLSELSALAPLFSKIMCADTVLKRVEKGIVSDDGRKALLQATRTEKISTRDTVLHTIVQVSKVQIGSGQYHVYRNVLNMEGNGIKSVFEIALKELVSSGFINEAQADVQRKEVESAIKGMG